MKENSIFFSLSVFTLFSVHFLLLWVKNKMTRAHKDTQRAKQINRF